MPNEDHLTLCTANISVHFTLYKMNVNTSFSLSQKFQEVGIIMFLILLQARGLNLGQVVTYRRHKWTCGRVRTYNVLRILLSSHELKCCLKWTECRISTVIFIFLFHIFTCVIHRRLYFRKLIKTQIPLIPALPNPGKSGWGGPGWARECVLPQALGGWRGCRFRDPHFSSPGSTEFISWYLKISLSQSKCQFSKDNLWICCVECIFIFVYDDVLPSLKKYLCGRGLSLPRLANS